MIVALRGENETLRGRLAAQTQPTPATLETNLRPSSRSRSFAVISEEPLAKPLREAAPFSKPLHLLDFPKPADPVSIFAKASDVVLKARPPSSSRHSRRDMSFSSQRRYSNSSNISDSDAGGIFKPGGGHRRDTARPKNCEGWAFAWSPQGGLELSVRVDRNRQPHAGALGERLPDQNYPTFNLWLMATPPLVQ